MGDYLTVIEVLSIHGAMIDEFGSTDGVRDLEPSNQQSLDAGVIQEFLGAHNSTM